ncbi:hypothetical protein [Psychrobacter sp.]|uniref:hypothetical protein n=1 Tax=Psychrobacter sp. TaxID=56811 RepID=UPI0035674455
MSDNSTNNDNIKKALESLENAPETPANDSVTGVEVVKGDTVVYEDGDFEDYNADQDYEVDEDAKSSKDDKPNKNEKKDEKYEHSTKEDTSANEDKHSTTIANIYQWASKLKEDLISDKKEPKSSEEDKSDADKEDKHSATIANIYQWAAKLKEDFTAEASNMTHDVSEKAVAIMLNRLLDAKTAELEAFDKKVADSEGSVENAEEERSKIADKKDKYQNMIDQLQG